MTTATKATKVNYTPEQESEMAKAFKESPTAETVEKLAESMGKKVRSIQSKLVRLGVYVKKEYKTKNGEKSVLKDTIANTIGTALNLSEGEASSLAKANRTALVKIMDALNAKAT